MFRRLRMVKNLMRLDAISTPEMAFALLTVPRHHFVPVNTDPYSLEAIPLPDGTSVTCPLFVSRMVELLELRAGQRVLEVGTGTGYQAAVLSALGYQVTSIEFSRELHLSARQNLERAGISGVDLRHGDGALGAPDKAPFDGVIFGCAIPQIPRQVAEQVRRGGRLVAPVGEPDVVQALTLFERTHDGWTEQMVRAAWFVPLKSHPQTDD